MARPVTLITGASAGIGMALARVFAAHGHELVLVARRKERLQQLAGEIAAKGGPTPIALPADLARTDAVSAIAAQMQDAGVEPEIVVNNAGFGIGGEAAALDRSTQLELVDVNVRALTDLSLAFVDSLVRHRGGLLNVASLAGFFPGPYQAVYYASKAYVLSFSEALHYELAPRGVRVTALCPGPVPTEFQARAGFTNNRLPPVITLSAEEVAEVGYRALKAGKRIAVPGVANTLIAALARFVPRKALMPLIEMHNLRRKR